MRSSKKPISSSPLSQLFATTLFFIGLTLTMTPPPSSVIAFADDTQGTASSGYDFITTSAAASSISLSIEDEEESPLRVAFVKPSFTFAAYQLNGFYNFYGKASDQAEGTTNVTIDLNLLTVRIPDGTYLYYKDDPFDSPRIPSQQQYYNTLRELVEDKASSQDLAIDIADITDKEVHEGSIFDSAGNNVYDVLFLFHQEYVTQAEYDNLKKFVVQNGGTIVFNDANIFTTEVKYDSATNTVTLVRGHGWAYNGNSAWRAENERWLNENQQWVGSNFIEIPANENVTFTNNPFNYDHSEEQIVTNPNAMIIFDFGVIEH
ncbi:MAG: N,N-dimethylformamidase beta subunit family domain-containing protein, partial [Nitrososphaera sp.]